MMIAAIIPDHSAAIRAVLSETTCILFSCLEIFWSSVYPLSCGDPEGGDRGLEPPEKNTKI